MLEEKGTLGRKSDPRKDTVKACMDIAFQNTDSGSLFVIELNDRKKNQYYTKVFETINSETGRPLSVKNDSDMHVLAHLAKLDGAMIIDSKGEMKEFGATLKNENTFFGHGKRHAFALGTSKLDGIVCVLSSEEDKHVRLFSNGVCIMDIDSKTRLPASTRQKVLDVLDTPLSKILIASGIATSILTLNPIPAIITITGTSVIVHYGLDKIKRLL